MGLRKEPFKVFACVDGEFIAKIFRFLQMVVRMSQDGMAEKFMPGSGHGQPFQLAFKAWHQFGVNDQDRQDHRLAQLLGRGIRHGGGKKGRPRGGRRQRRVVVGLAPWPCLLYTSRCV